MRIQIQDEAHRDILHQYRYYLIEKNAPEAAERFLDAVQTAIGTLVGNPGIGVLKAANSAKLMGLRSWPVRGYSSIRIYYLYSDAVLRIVRVLHGKRDLGRLLEDSTEDD